MAGLLAAHAGTAAPRHRALWAFDARLAHVARTTSEPAIAQMRLAWWNDVITDGVKGRGEPVVDAMRATGAMAAPGLAGMIDGWEVLAVEPEIGPEGLRDYAAGRGGGLFRALADAPVAPDWLDASGQVWALWDLAGHVHDAALARAAGDLARTLLPQADAARWTSALRPLRIAYTLARQDVLEGRGAPTGISRRFALRLMRIALVGR
nr:hypothetical protein [Sphingobium sp. OAS761]